MRDDDLSLALIRSWLARLIDLIELMQGDAPPDMAAARIRDRYKLL